MSLWTLRGRIWLLGLVVIYLGIFNYFMERTINGYNVRVNFGILFLAIFLSWAAIFFLLKKHLSKDKAVNLFWINLLALFISSLWPAYWAGYVLALISSAIAFFGFALISIYAFARMTDWE